MLLRKSWATGSAADRRMTGVAIFIGTCDRVILSVMDGITTGDLICSGMNDSVVHPFLYFLGSSVKEVSLLHIDSHTITHTNTHINTHKYIYIHIHIHTYTYTYAHTNTHTYTYAQTYTHTHIQIHIHTYTYTCNHTNKQTCNYSILLQAKPV
jgi:hypothetical protein